MRIGIIRSTADRMSGGVFQYEMVLLSALTEVAARHREEFVYLSSHPQDLGLLAIAGNLKYGGISVLPTFRMPTRLPPPETYLAEVPTTPAPLNPDVVEFNDATYLYQNGLELLLVLSPNVTGFTFRLPFIVPIFDLNHKLQPEFLEVSAYGELNIRDHFYINTCRFATLILVDSEMGKADVLRFYGDFIDEDRIRILPYYPPIKNRPMPNATELARVRAKYDLPPRFFFYPAQFWSHKNHELIVRATKLLADESGEAMPVVLTGAYWTYIMAKHFKEIMSLAGRLGVADRIRHVGSVPDEDMGALYTLSAGLVMPTFFGPTNIPPLEAWHFGRPVITSDIRGVREQIGDAGILVNPRSPEALANAMKQLWRDDALCAQLVARGKKRLATYSWDAFLEKVAAVVMEARERVRSGRTPRYPDVAETARYPKIARI
jgi:glycosyltransferase involved in cell wall biosynthesis